MGKNKKKTANANSQTYEDKSINSLILFSIYRVREAGRRCTFERLMEECFKLSPRTFCLAGHTEWPDSRKLDRPLRSLREEKLVSGDPKTCFVLTKEGEKLAEEMAKTFRQGKLRI
ncbi:MAG: hypothetical protein COT34_00205 [Candidatus Nealsonbacteria bacterium CG08_land_8_20_14_0_20_43_11]|uniref:ArnR1-like winged helix-turn-helix domain-containing protein n=1 Tax=Candidatus Nealsonbacteria bacterium CG08_land_8_20_14_0_20_43_11 TaxID=1974706 RepID=A0A2M6T1B0_9BACT|nr:MAG: hypothetical protein COT34_00205 [Candidatus Nealsonbacteria bacterium CG08_land_8_20_14_0_20_43_11]